MPRRGTVVVTSMASDSHTWNLVFLQLLIEELGYDVVNLGPCVPDEILVDECGGLAPSMVVISSVNGHGYQDGMRVVGKLRSDERLAGVPLVIGGMLGVSAEENSAYVDELIAAGFHAVFEGNSTTAFRDFVDTLPLAASRTAEMAVAAS
ncbi:cobalamin B12-binding domain-containing protein [Streptomyces sp. NPDC008163]|uniref:cobalamin B12-binding domain-containing protein n=1 Tax=Streptomyces sp. NPDC008163 TaxID=3364818 RepID=UPI0036F16F67